MANVNYQVACPSWEASVPIKSSASIGKKIECPKCKYRFVVPEPPEEDADAGKKAGKEGAKKGKKGAKKGGSKVLIGVGLGVLAVGVLVVGAIFVLGGGDDKPSGSANANTVRPGPSTAPPTTSNTNTAEEKGVEDKGTGEGTKTGEQADPTAQPAITDPTAAPTTEKKAPTPAAPAPPAGGLKDVTNLLPGETRAVYRVNMDRLATAATPVHAALLDKNIRD